MKTGILLLLLLLVAAGVIVFVVLRGRSADKKKDAVTRYVCDQCGEKVCECRKEVE